MTAKPCLTCRPIILSQVKIFLWATIRAKWDAANFNMHKALVYVLTSTNHKCGLLHGGFANVTSSYICQVAGVAEKYNLTLVEFKGQQQINWMVRISEFLDTRMD